jgi:lipopolysaccharide/colanic/teichoic acid biosynthesis glycosyltransferase
MRSPEPATTAFAVASVAEEPVVACPALHEPAWARFVRRSFDTVVAAIVLVLTSPVLLGAVIAIRIESGGPAFFWQERVGRCGRRFRMLKLRGMYTDARERFPELYAYTGDGHKAGAFHFHADDDPRVTKVGRFLRRTSIDELPNFWNVLKGDMSVVGPRPDIPELMPLYGERAAVVLSVRPGVTSLPKSSGRDGLSFEETLALEVSYVQNRSLWLDIKIVANTIPTVLLQRNVSPG